MMSASSSGCQTRVKFKYAIIGGGIAGVTCVEMLSQLCPDESIILVTASPLIKTVTNVRQVTEMIQDFDVNEEPPSQLEAKYLNVTVVQREIALLDSVNKVIHTIDGTNYTYEKLCLCTGATPKMISQDSPYVLGIRDTETVKMFQKRLLNARRVIVVGNGGIATELVYQIEGCEVVWAIKDASINCVFLDAGASHFLLPRLNEPKKSKRGPVKRMMYTLEAGSKEDQQGGSGTAMGSALGPDWSVKLPIRGADLASHRITVEYSVEVERLMSAPELEQAKRSAKVPLQIYDEFSRKPWPVFVQLSNGKVYGCDFVVSATGVQPCTQIFTGNNEFDIAEDGGIKVNKKMQTSVSDIYAAGDVCTTSWEPAPHWLQMRLWGQARQMGAYAAQCMIADSIGDDIDLDICFELFTHVTTFFNNKIVLLGRFNAQGLGEDYEILLRVTEGVEYVKAILKDNRMQGAILIGETDLEEVFENLILNQTNLINVKDALLDPDIDIQDYFD